MTSRGLDGSGGKRSMITARGGAGSGGNCLQNYGEIQIMLVFYII